VIVVAAGTRIASEPPAVEAVSPAAAAERVPSTRFQPRPVATDWPTTGVDRSRVLQLVTSASFALPQSRVESNRRRGLPLLMDWLEEHPGQTWQERWLASGADAAGENWARGPAQWLEREGKYSRSRLELMTSSLLMAVGADIVRPSLRWLLTGGKKRKLARNMIRSRDQEGFEKLRLLCEQDPGITPHAQSHILFRTAVILAAKGDAIADISIGDVLEVLDTEFDLRGHTRSGSATFRTDVPHFSDTFWPPTWGSTFPASGRLGGVGLR